MQTDLTRAYYWLALAANRETKLFDDAARARDELAPRLSPRELAEAKRMLAATAPPDGMPLWASLLASPAAMPAPGELCPSLARVMAAAAASFVPLRGKGSEQEGWDATEALPGTRHCRIRRAVHELWLPPYGYRCVVSAGDDTVVADTDLENMRRLVSHCLGGSWRNEEVRRSDSTTVDFSRGRLEPSLALERRVVGPTQAVTLKVSAPVPTKALGTSLTGEPIGLDAPIDVKIKDTGAGDVLGSFSAMLGADVFIDADVTGSVTLDRKDAPVHEVLDAVCAQVGCVWSFDSKGPRRQLLVHRKAP